MNPWRCLPLISCLAFAASLAQSPEPYHVKDDVLGETVAAYRRNHQNERDCVLRKELRSALAPSVQTCTTLAMYQQMTYGNHPVWGRKVAFDDGKLYSIYMTFSSDTYDRMLGLLTEKFGAPASTRSETAVWTNGVSTIMLAGEPKAVTITFSLDALQRDAEKKQDAQAKKRKPDM
jgi:hypothetical protein